MRMKKILTLVSLVLGIYCAQAQTNAGAFASMKLGEPVMFDNAIPQITTKADASSFAGGSGTEADPYLVATVEHLRTLAAMSIRDSEENLTKLKGVYFKQIADIVFGVSDPQIFIGNGAWFAGTYDGDGYAIKNYSLRQNFRGTSAYMALFMNCSGATLKNVHMVGTKIDVAAEGTDLKVSVGGLAGNFQAGQIMNCTTDGSYIVQISGSASNAFIGGLVSFLTNSTIDNCRSYGNYRNEVAVEGGSRCFTEIGGIAAEMVESKIINCISYNEAKNFAQGNVDVLNVRTAGIAAYALDAQVLNSSSRGESLVSIANNNQQEATSYVYTAGVVAILTDKSLISNCWNVVPTLKSEGATKPIEPNPICYLFTEDATLSNCYYSNGEASEASMKSQEFVDKLNENLPEGALTWQLRNDGYPTLQVLHSVILPSLIGATTTPNEGTSKIEDGERFRFTLTLDEEYNESKPVVTVGDKTLEPDADMNYVTDRVTADMVIKITGIVKNTATANEKITIGSKVYVTGGVLYIQPEAPVKVSVFNMQGRLIKSAMISGDTQMQLPQGIYLVRLADQSYKISISE